jgi:hypothetical protein
MDITETLAKEKKAIKNGHYRDTGNKKRGNQEWTLQRHWQQKKRQSRMDITETLATEKEAIKNGHYRDTGNRKRGNQEWTLQRHWQHCINKTQDEEKQNTKLQHNTEN